MRHLLLGFKQPLRNDPAYLRRGSICVGLPFGPLLGRGGRDMLQGFLWGSVCRGRGLRGLILWLCLAGGDPAAFPPAILSYAMCSWTMCVKKQQQGGSADDTLRDNHQHVQALHSAQDLQTPGML